MIIYQRLFLILFLFFVIQFDVSAQKKKELEDAFEKTKQTITYSAVNYSKSSADTAKINLDSSYKELMNSYVVYYDSVYRSVKSLITQPGKDSLSAYSEFIRNWFYKYHRSLKDSINSVFKKFSDRLMNSERNAYQCEECETSDDFDEGAEEYTDILDSLCDIFDNNIYTLSDSLEVSLEDTLNFYMDDIADYALEIVEEIANRKGNANNLARVEEYNDDKEFSNDILISGSYLTHDNYRGRDFGDVQNSFSGMAAYTHKTGLGGYLSYYNLMNTKAFVDEIDIGITYQFNIIEDYFDGSVALAHSWYNDSNSKGVGGLNNLLNASFNYSYGVLGVSAMFDLLFGGSTREFSFTFNPYCTIPVSKNFLNGALSVEPGITAIIGQQDYSVILKRKKNPLKTVQTNSSFGIMDYEFSLPVEYEHKYFTFRPSITLIVPVNVIDQSTNIPFGCFSLDVEVPIRF